MINSSYLDRSFYLQHDDDHNDDDCVHVNELQYYVHVDVRLVKQP